MRKNLQVEVPRGAHAEVQRKRGLKKSIFTRTRIAVLSLILVLSLSVTGTLAYLQWTANQTPNRSTVGEVELHIVENVNTSTTAVTDTDSNTNFGTGNKVVKLKAGTAANRVPEKVRVTFVPEVQYKDGDGNTLNANVAMAEDWSADATTDTSGTYFTYGLLKFYVNADWKDKWDYSDGTFTYKTTLGKGEETENLLLGVDYVTASDADNYGTVKVNVIADAIQEGTSSTW